jgi:hypothetical protein
MKQKSQPNCSQVSPLPGSPPREALAGIQVFSKTEEASGVVVRQPFRLAGRKSKFFQRLHLGLFILLLVFLGGEEIRAQSGPLLSTNGAATVPFKLNLGVETSNQPQDVDIGIKVLVPSRCSPSPLPSYF